VKKYGLVQRRVPRPSKLLGEKELTTKAQPS
jgi:hypothetical protein